MSAETKMVFDQLTEDAMKLMENGELGRVCYFNGLNFSFVLSILYVITCLSQPPGLLSTLKI